uniref:Kazrin, periplakin interacting protein n=1 Tax=Terrapene triunguis TaxID=2587831 RepID=A0A674KGI9_9SAUR
MMEDNKQLALRIDGAIQSASQEMTNLRAELTATNRRLAELGSSAATPSIMENNQHNAQGEGPAGLGVAVCVGEGGGIGEGLRQAIPVTPFPPPPTVNRFGG